MPASVGQSDWWSGGHGFDPHQVREHSSVEIFYDHSLPSADSKKVGCKFLAKECAQVVFNRLEV